MLDVFVQRGEQLARSRRSRQDDPAYTSATALTSVHAAIAFNDALLIKLTGIHVPGQDHAEPARRTRKLCQSRKIPVEGLLHLEKLLAAKSKVSYSSDRTTHETALALVKASERFEAWVKPLLNT